VSDEEENEEESYSQVLSPREMKITPRDNDKFNSPGSKMCSEREVINL